MTCEQAKSRMTEHWSLTLGEAEDAEARPRHQIISGRFSASQ